MKSFRTFLVEKINANFVGYSRQSPSMVGYSAKPDNFIKPTKDSKRERSPFIDQNAPERPNPLKSRGAYHLYNKSSKQVTTRTQPFKKQKDAESYLDTLAQRSREHLQVVYHDKGGTWHEIGDNGIIAPTPLKILNKKK